MRPQAVENGAVRDGAVRDGAVRDGAVRDGAVRGDRAERQAMNTKMQRIKTRGSGRP